MLANISHPSRAKVSYLAAVPSLVCQRQVELVSLLVSCAEQGVTQQEACNSVLWMQPRTKDDPTSRSQRWARTVRIRSCMFKCSGLSGCAGFGLMLEQSRAEVGSP